MVGGGGRGNRATGAGPGHKPSTKLEPRHEPRRTRRCSFDIVIFFIYYVAYLYVFCYFFFHLLIEQRIALLPKRHANLSLLTRLGACVYMCERVRPSPLSIKSCHCPMGGATAVLTTFLIWQIARNLILLPLIDLLSPRMKQDK